MRAISIALLTGLFFAAPALAEPPPGGYEGAPPPDGTAPPPDPNAPPAVDAYGQPVSDPSSVQVVEQTEPASRANHFQVGLHVMVPIFTNQFEVTPLCDFDIRLCGATTPLPGIAGQLFVGWEFKHGISARLGLGASFNRAEAGTSSALTDVWGFAQARYSFLNRTALVPFAQLGIQLNFFSACYDDGVGGCTSVDYQTTLGGFLGGGVMVEITETLALEVGMNVNISGRGIGGQFFDTTPVWLTPFLGGVLFL